MTFSIPEPRRVARGMLWATWLATIAAFIGVGVSTWYNRETVEIARSTYNEARQTQIDQSAQFQKAQQESAADRQAQQERFERGQLYEVAKAEQQRAESTRLELLARSPLL